MFALLRKLQSFSLIWAIPIGQRRTEAQATVRIVIGFGVVAFGLGGTQIKGHYLNSSTGSTPKTVSPEAMTKARPCTRARRAAVSSG